MEEKVINLEGLRELRKHNKEQLEIMYYLGVLRRETLKDVTKEDRKEFKEYYNFLKTQDEFEVKITLFGIENSFKFAIGI